MNDIYATIRDSVLDRTADLSPEDLRIRGLWRVHGLFQPSPSERCFDHYFLLALTLGQGCCYSVAETDIGREMIGKDARDIIASKSEIGVAVMDSILAGLPRTPHSVYTVTGSPLQKAKERAGIIVDEAVALTKPRAGCRPKAVNVGVVGMVIDGLVTAGYQVAATDLDPEVVGREFSGVRVEHGDVTCERVAEADLAIVTGMTMATNTLEDIVEAAKAGGTRLVMFAETGANLAEEYCRSAGLDTVAAETFPFYIFQGTSTIEVFRRERADG